MARKRKSSRAEKPCTSLSWNVTVFFTPRQTKPQTCLRLLYSSTQSTGFVDLGESRAPRPRRYFHGEFREYRTMRAGRGLLPDEIQLSKGLL